MQRYERYIPHPFYPPLSLPSLVCFHNERLAGREVVAAVIAPLAALIKAAFCR